MGLLKRRVPTWMAEARAKKLKAAKRAAAKTARKGTQAKRQASRSPKPKRHFVEGAVGTRRATEQEIAAAEKRSAKLKRKRAAAKRTGTQAKRKASRSPGGFAGGGAIESYSSQVQRKYGGGKV